MNEISCEICQDLLPLVQDNVASEDSRQAVLQHIAECEHCRALQGANTDLSNAPEPKNEQMLVKARRYLNALYTVLMLFGIYFGLSLTYRMDMFYNCLIMPVVGAVGYMLLGKKAFAVVPGLLLIVSIPVNELLLEKALSLRMMFSGTLIYIGFAVVGIIIAMLLKYAFGKEKKA